MRSLLLFGLIDEANLDRWQAGLVRADKSRRPSWATVRAALGVGCCSKQAVWRHTESVVGAEVRRVPGVAVVTAEEDAVVRVAGRTFQLRAYRPRTIRAVGRPWSLLSADEPAAHDRPALEGFDTRTGVRYAPNTCSLGSSCSSSS